MEKFKRFAALLLSLCLLATMLPATVFAEQFIDSGTCGSNLIWTLDEEGTLTISGTGEMSSSPWSKSIKNVIIKDGVTNICYKAFYNCINLESITIPDSVTTIGDYAFQECSSLKSIIIADSVTSIGNYVFKNCSSLENITLPNCTTRIGYSAFENCSSLERIAIPDGVTSIGKFMFLNCSSLKSISIPDSVTTIAYYAFSSCSKLTDVYYSGGAAQWEAISIGTENIDLTGAYIHYHHIHDYSLLLTTGVAATCTENGCIIYSCVCGDSNLEDVLATGHDFTDDYCANCGQAPAVILKVNDSVIARFASVTDALKHETDGQNLVLQADVVDADVILPAGVNLDLNGYVLTTDSILTYTGSSIIDTSEDVSGLLKINEADGNMISADNSSLPVYDSENGGYRFFVIDVEPCTVTGGNKYWFKIKAEKFAPLYELILSDADVQIKVKMIWDGQTEDTYAAAYLSFTKTWADSYNANDDVYITVTVNEAEGVENFKLIPMITSGGVEISGTEM